MLPDQELMLPDQELMLLDQQLMLLDRELMLTESGAYTTLVFLEGPLTLKTILVGSNLVAPACLASNTENHLRKITF